MKQCFINDLKKVKEIYFGENWIMRKDIVSLYDSHLRSKHDEDHVEKYLFSEYILRDICSFYHA